MNSNKVTYLLFSGLSILFLPLLQNVTSVDAIFNWWYFGLGGLGGWALFLLAIVGANIYLFLDSQARKVSAISWKIATLSPTVLILPTVIFVFSSNDTRIRILSLLEPFFFLGIVGGIVPISAAVGYAINFTGYIAPQESSSPPASTTPVPAPPRRNPPRRPVRPQVNAWLIESQSNRDYQLFQGDTKIGRGKHNDIPLSDRAVSREHALIREENGHFTLYDRGSKTGVILNGQRLQGSELLAHGDMIEMGDTQLQFVTGR